MALQFLAEVQLKGCVSSTVLPLATKALFLQILKLNMKYHFNPAYFWKNVTFEMFEHWK